MADDQGPAWHQALAYAVTGHRLDGLGRQRKPDLTSLVRVLSEHTDLAQPLGPAHPVPPELMSGIGAAQFLAALAQLRRELSPVAELASVAVNRPLTADERRLLSDVPPHHGT